jgi:predicted amidophosphoribosyltransferase
MRGAFACRDIEQPESVLLVDDVLTTGATSTAAANALKRAGARAVDLLVLARSGSWSSHRRMLEKWQARL